MTAFFTQLSMNPLFHGLFLNDPCFYVNHFANAIWQCSAFNEFLTDPYLKLLLNDTVYE